MIARSLCIALGSPGDPSAKYQSSFCKGSKAVLETLPALRRKNLACWSPLPEYGERDNCHVAHL